jgi:hypothetical protein
MTDPETKKRRSATTQRETSDRKLQSCQSCEIYDEQGWARFFGQKLSGTSLRRGEERRAVSQTQCEKTMPHNTAPHFETLCVPQQKATLSRNINIEQHAPQPLH